MNKEKKPLFRKEKKTGLSTHYYVSTGSDFRHQRHTKKMKEYDGNHMPMKSGKFGVDYTPLYLFLLSKIGCKWDEVFSEICERLPLEHRKSIFRMVRLIESVFQSRNYHSNDVMPSVRIGENSYWNTLEVINGVLVKVDPNFTAKDCVIGCTCCTHSFNGKPIKK